MKQVKVKSPTRIDLAGGTLDMWPLYNFVEGRCFTFNLGIDIFSEASIVPTEDGSTVLNSLDLNLRTSYKNFRECVGDKDRGLSLLRAIVAEFPQLEGGFELITSSMSPVGGGLGGSSSLTISIIKVICESLELSMSPTAMVHLAHNIEARILGTPTGTQDYYPPILGGMLKLEYSARETTFEQLDFSANEFNDCMSIVYTGAPHHSGLNNFEVLKAAVAKETGTLKALNELAEVSRDLAELITYKNWVELPGIFAREYEHRTQLSPVVSSPQIKDLKNLASEFSSSIKICGAGGGGCVMIWSKPDKKAELEKAVTSNGFEVLQNKVFQY